MKAINSRVDYIANLAEAKKKDSILTIGVANIPELESKLEKIAKNCQCLDFDLNKIKKSRPHLKKTKFLHADITKANKKLFNKFDTIIMLEVLEHIEKDFETLNNINRMLKKGGKLIISVPNKHILHILNPVRYIQHKRHYSMEEITDLLKKAGFSIQFTNTVESPKLIIDLYVHLFCRYILRKNVPFGILTGKKDKTYGKNNTWNKGMDCLVVAIKN